MASTASRARVTDAGGHVGSRSAALIAHLRRHAWPPVTREHTPSGHFSQVYDTRWFKSLGRQGYHLDTCQDDILGAPVLARLPRPEGGVRGRAKPL